MISLNLPWPPSINTMYATYLGRRILSKRGRLYHRTVVALLCGERDLLPQPLMGRLRVTRHYYPPDRRRRDISNHSKAIDDALTKAAVWGDDSQIDESHDFRGEIVKDGCVRVDIEEIFSPKPDQTTAHGTVESFARSGIEKSKR